MTQVERVAAQIEDMFDGRTGDEIALALARWHLAVVRRAKGRTVAWTTYDLDRPEEWCCRKDCEEAARGNPAVRVARVVLVPRAGRRKA